MVDVTLVHESETRKIQSSSSAKLEQQHGRIRMYSAEEPFVRCAVFAGLHARFYSSCTSTAVLLRRRGN